MTEEEADRILDMANYLLDWFPYEAPEVRYKKNFRRKSYLRAKYIKNRKIFFGFLKEKYQGINKRDKARRFKIIPYLRNIFSCEIPTHKQNSFMYLTEKNGGRFTIVVKEIMRHGKKELYLISIYPTE